MLTGASGLVGTWLRRAVPAEVELVSLTHRTMVPEGGSIRADLRKPADVTTAFRSTRPLVVIHAAMAVDEVSITDATSNVADAAAAVGADVVYLSTDAVFSGDGRPVGERERPDPISDYGRWKARAEQRILSEPAGCVVRLPLVVSLDPPDSAVERIRHWSRQHEATRWFRDETRQPAMGSDIAAALWRISLLAPGERVGIWQLPGPERLTRYEIAQRVVDTLCLDPGAIVSVPRPPGASRPQHLNLLDDRARDEIGWDPAPILS